MYENVTLDLFKALIVNPSQKTENYVIPELGLILDFVPTRVQEQALREYFKPLPITTLFTVEERMNGDPVDLIHKQILHYIEIYGLGMPGLFDLEVTEGKVLKVNYVSGVTDAWVRTELRDLLRTNAPVKNVEDIKNLVVHLGIVPLADDVANSELRIALYDPNRSGRFSNGDDAVRYLCYKATGSTLLIKSKEVVAAVASYSRSVSVALFLDAHTEVLATVFNRHKRLIMAAKNGTTKMAINKISRLSKTKHVPVHEAFSKRFVSSALNGNVASYAVLDSMSLRDRFKFLNLLEHKKMRRTEDVFIIRNGKAHLEPNRPTYSVKDINKVIDEVVASLGRSLADLKNQNILLDPNVDYGLPISRKQTLGNLPFGTRIVTDSKNISAGIYWENEWGANDLDLSSIDTGGNRIGWGSYSAYSDRDIVYSGDVTYAPRGAMEFMTSKTSLNYPYGLLVNVYSGGSDASLELVVGERADDDQGRQNTWITKTVVREKHRVPGRGAFLGFVKDGAFIVYAPAVSASHVSSPRSANIVRRGVSNFWTVTDLLDIIGVNYDLAAKKGKTYDHDLSYSSFSLDKLEKML